VNGWAKETLSLKFPFNHYRDMVFCIWIDDFDFSELRLQVTGFLLTEFWFPVTHFHSPGL